MFIHLRSFFYLLLFLLLCFASLRIQAHDLWIEPSAFSAAIGETVGVRLREGEHLIGEPVALNPQRVNQFLVQDASDRRTIAGRRGAEPAGALRIRAAGLNIIGYHTHPKRLDLAAEKFTAYLREEGLESIVSQRAARNETDKEGREVFYRCAKSLILSGVPKADENDRLLGFPLELVALQNPYTLKAGEPLSVRLIYENKPVEGVLVMALNSSNPADRQAIRSDAEGRVRFVIPPDKVGLWLIKAVHMVPATKEGEEGADWASYWASLTFAVAANPEKNTPASALK